MSDNESFMESMLELGIGMTMVRQMMPNMMGCMQNACAGTSPAATPPPPPQQQSQQSTTGCYVAVNGQQAGPFSDDELGRMMKAGLVTADTLIWKPGMPTWKKASEVPEVNKLFVLSQI